MVECLCVCVYVCVRWSCPTIWNLRNFKVPLVFPLCPLHLISSFRGPDGSITYFWYPPPPRSLRYINTHLCTNTRLRSSSSFRPSCQSSTCGQGQSGPMGLRSGTLGGSRGGLPLECALMMRMICNVSAWSICLMCVCVFMFVFICVSITSCFSLFMPVTEGQNELSQWYWGLIDFCLDHHIY